MLETIFLYVILHDDNSNGERFRTEMPDMETCLKVVSNAKMPTPNKPSGDYEVMGVMWCAGDNFQRNYQAKWYKDGLSDPSK